MWNVSVGPACLKRSKALIGRLRSGDFIPNSPIPKTISFLEYIRKKISHMSVTCPSDLIDPLHFFASVDDDINVPPFDLDSALIRWLMTSPTPTEVFEFIPSLEIVHLGSFGDDFLPGESILDPCPRRISGPDLSELDVKYPKNAGRPGGKLHCDPSTVARSCRDPLTSAIARWLLDRDNSETKWESTMASSLLLLPHLSATSRDIFVPYLFSLNFGHLDVPAASKFFKRLHTFIRITRTVPGHSRQLTAVQANHLYGIDLLTGPSEQLPLDMADEIRQRMTPSAFNAVPTPNLNKPLDKELYMEYFRRALKEVIEEDLPPKMTWPTFEDWYSDRLGWAAAGGAPGFKINWGDEKERLNKRGALLSMPFDHVNSMLRNNECPLHYSKGAVKFEKGKKRAIWNTSIYHYLYQAYVLDCLDSQLRSKDTAPDGPSPANWNSSTHHAAARLATQAQRLAQLASSEGVGLMWDFSDFNINHSLETMVILFSTLGKALAERNQSNKGSDYLTQVQQDFDDAISWISKARVNTILDSADQDNPLIAEILRSLQSGERATSFTNTFENRIYLKIADYTAFDLFHHQLVTNTRSQQGDDVFLIGESLFDAIIECAVLNISGAAGQTYKITLDYTGRGEFLRYGYSASARQVSGYPVRSGLGLISGEFFMDPVVDPDARGVAYLEAFNRANLRGAILPSSFLDALLSRNCAIVFTTSAGKKVRVTPDLEFALTPGVFGGLGVSGYPPMTVKPNGAIRSYNAPIPRPTYQPPKFDSSAAFSKFSYADQTTLHKLGLGQQLSRKVHDLAAASALTGAYRAKDQSSSIAKFAEALHLYNSKRQMKYLELPTNRTSFSKLRQPILEAWTMALGLYESSSQSGRPGTALILPSGGGKTTLARDHPDLFIDHDDYVPFSQIRPLVEQQMWTELNRSHATRPIPYDGRILLTWSIDTAPRGFVPVQVPLVSEFVGPRLFTDNLAHILKSSPNLITYYATFADREEALVRFATNALSSFNDANFKPSWGDSVTFKPSRAPVHHYGSAAIYTRPCGFSLQEALILAVDELTPKEPYTGSFGKWGRMFSYVRPDQLPSQHPDVLRFLTDGYLDDTLQSRMKYFLGKMSWLPPFNQNHSPDVLTVARDITLQLLEEYCTDLFRLPDTDIVLSVADLEREVTYLFEDVITPQYLNSSVFLG